ncbi:MULTISPECIES: methyltransferase [Brevibacterium]|uniref:methyltransferase n=1 Tax=Brevibacterium TaxID=1696 RepID=UPI000C7816C8|nr:MULTISPECIES: methyltransferase [Brevibacterium]HCG57245.1 hypothetical protein [Brevibacterium sp.]
MSAASVAAHLRHAGCVFAEDEARILIQAAQESSSDTADREATLTGLTARRVAGEPLEQVVGWVEFAGQRLAVAPNVFVPRQRTTLLAKQSVRAVREAGAGARFLEAFCGVGPVAASVLRASPEAEIHIGDRDESTLACARRNIGPHGEYHLLNCLDGLPQHLAGSFDVISAVPPYVPDAAAMFLPREARDHETSAALFGGADGLDLVRRLIGESHQWLSPGGVVLIECGIEQQHTAVEFAATAGFSASIVLGDDEQTTVLKLR